jgi:hypothetical protein
MAIKPWNRTAAFIEYSRGTALEDIAHALAIPLDALMRWSHEDKWSLMVPKLPVAILPRAGAEAERAMERIRVNREKNLLVAIQLQEDLTNVVTKLLDGSLKIEKVFANGSRAILDPGVADRQGIALYAKHVAELSYRALGDVESTRGVSEGGGSQVGQITIILPGAVAAPREKRSQVVDATLSYIEVESVPETTPTSS